MSNRTKRSGRKVVVDLGRGEIKLALAETASEAVRFTDISRIDVDRGATGEVDSDLVQAAIRAEVQKRGWQGMPAACLLSGQATSTQSFLFPPMPREDLRRAIALKLRETLHFEVDHATFDFQTTPVVTAEGEHKVLTLVAAARLDAVREAVSILRAAGLKPTAASAAAESLANLSRGANLCRADEATMHVDLGARTAIVNLFEGSDLRFSRELDVAGDAFTEALLRPILTSSGAVQLTPLEARAIREIAGYPDEDESLELPHGIQPRDILPLLEPVAQRLATELARSIDYLRSITGRTNIDRILLSGTTGSLRNLDAYLAASLNTPVEYSDPVERAMWHWRLAICDEEPRDLPGYGAILGYSLGSHQPIDLIPREDRLQQVSDRISSARRSVVPASLALAACMMVAGVPAVDPGRGRVLQLEGEIARLKGVHAEQLARDSVHANTRERLANVLADRGLIVPWRGVFQELARAVPDGASLDSADVSHTSTGPVMTLEVRIQDMGTSIEPVLSSLTAALSGSPFLCNVQLLDAWVEPESEQGIFSLSVGVIGLADEAWEKSR